MMVTIVVLLSLLLFFNIAQLGAINQVKDAIKAMTISPLFPPGSRD